MRRRRIGHEQGWYGSFKWLTSPRYLDGRGLTGYAAEFARALRAHFEDLGRFQQRARRLGQALGAKPVAPDLWLIVDGRHRFIEVKLPGDSVSARQLAGMALIGRCLRADRPISLSIVQLYPRERIRPEPIDEFEVPRAVSSRRRVS